MSLTFQEKKENLCKSNEIIDEYKKELYGKCIKLCLHHFEKFESSDRTLNLRNAGVIEKEGIYFYLKDKIMNFSVASVAFEYRINLVEKEGTFIIFINDFEVPTFVDTHGVYLNFQNKVKKIFEEVEVEYKLIKNKELSSVLKSKTVDVDYFLSLI